MGLGNRRTFGEDLDTSSWYVLSLICLVYADRKVVLAGSDNKLAETTAPGIEY